MATVRLRQRRPSWERARERGRGACEVSTGSGRCRRGASRCHAGANDGRQAGWWCGKRGGIAVSLLCLLAEVGDDWQRRWAGPARWAAYWAIQVSQVSLSLSLLFPVFYFLQLFWLY